MFVSYIRFFVFGDEMLVQPAHPPHRPRQDQDRGFKRPSFDTQIRPIGHDGKTLSRGVGRTSTIREHRRSENNQKLFVWDRHIKIGYSSQKRG